MSDIELPPLPAHFLQLRGVKLWNDIDVREYARAAVELNQKPASADVEAMCAWLESMANTMAANDDLNIFGRRVERLREAAAMLRSLDASLTAYRNPHTVWQCEQNGCCFEDMRRRIATLEAERERILDQLIAARREGYLDGMKAALERQA